MVEFGRPDTRAYLSELPSWKDDGMSVAELARLIGRTGTWQHGGLLFEITVSDVRTRFGGTDLLIVPVSGLGEAWVQDNSVVLS